VTQIRVENLRKAFGDFVAVQGSTFTIEDRSFFVMLGPSGCGKTTTLRMVAGLEMPTEGRILLDGEDVTFRRAAERDIAFVFQLFALYPHMNVADNIGFPLKCQGLGRDEIRKQVNETARLLRIEVSKRFGKIEAIRDLALDIATGEFVFLLGPTGAGKTTTLRLIAGLERPDSGRISIDGEDVTKEPPAARDIAFVFQQYSLYPHLTVYDNLAFPLRAPARRLPEAEIGRRVHEIAELLRIGDKLGNRATRLSGGEMQRVAIGRALVRRPAIYLMDEPLSSLDAKLRAELRLELKRIQVDLGATVLYVTHDQIEAMTMASRIGVIRAGSLIQIGTPREIYESPNDLYVATRLGSPQINLLPVEMLPEAKVSRRASTVGVRTEHLQIAKPEGSGLVARVRRVEHLGDQNHVHLEYKGHALITLADPHRPLAAGQEVGLTLVNPLYFDAAGRRIGVAAE
jgi:multiple sugar transport system ATP-binding protein